MPDLWNFEVAAFLARFVLLLILLPVGWFLLPKISWLKKSIGDRETNWLGIFFAVVLTSWFVLFQTSILPLNVNIKFHRIYTGNASPTTEDLISEIRRNIPDTTQPEGTIQGNSQIAGQVIVTQPQDWVGDAAILQLTAVPKPKRVYILIHPHNTQYWYVQTPASFNEQSGYWEGVVYFGPFNSDCGLQYDLVALASRNIWVVDVFRGRILFENDKSNYLPVLNRSDVFVVTKVCELSE